MRAAIPWFLFVVVGVGALFVWQGRASRAPEVDRATALVRRETLRESTIATGVLRPQVGAEIAVGSRISGTVLRLPVAVGDFVEAGQLLAQLDPAALEAERAQAAAELELARARRKLAATAEARARALHESQLLPPADYEDAATNLEMEHARVAAAEARLRLAEIALADTQIRAPIDGVIAEVSTREGETVAAGFAAPTFVRIVDLDRLELLAYVDQTDIGRIFVGQRATFTVDTYPDSDFQAVVRAIQPKAEIQGSVVNYVARLEYEPRSECTLRPEMTAHLRLFLGEEREVLTVPRNALRHRDGREHVVVQRGGEWIEQEVRTGWRSTNRVEVLGGVTEGEALELNPS